MTPRLDQLFVWLVVALIASTGCTDNSGAILTVSNTKWETSVQVRPKSDDSAAVVTAVNNAIVEFMGREGPPPTRDQLLELPTAEGQTVGDIARVTVRSATQYPQ
ncbi:MAG: hypothetical protein AAGJ46_10735 [Planctomycetota bacterium]